MYLDARTLPSGAQVRTRVCVIGAGPAGIALACTLQRRGLEVSLLESGGLLPDPRTSDWDAGTTEGLPFEVEETRSRCFGGTSHIWAGRCVEMDESDFASRSWIPNSGWPFTKEHLDPFYARAGAMVDPRREDATKIPPHGMRLDPRQLELRSCWIRPTDFGEEHRRHFRSESGVQVYLNARVVRIDLNGAGDAVRKVIASTAQGNRFSVRADFFVVATGGIETPRLLLSSDHQCAGGIGNQYGLVGRFFGNHLYIDSALVDPTLPLTSCVLRPGTRQYWWFLLSPRYARDNRLLSCGGYLRPVYSYARNAGYQARGPRAVRLLAGSFRRRRFPADLGQSARDCLSQPLQVARYLAQRTRFQMKANPQLVFRSCVEGVPNPENRVRLLPETDSMGIRRVFVRWKADALDGVSLGHLHSVLRSQFHAKGLGTVRLLHDFEQTDWWDRIGDGKHHMGTTRMHPDRRQGVVDENCRVHSTRNLFVAGSSVFPTYSCANPTLTIVALAIRLAEHLAIQVQRPAARVRTSKGEADAG